MIRKYLVISLFLPLALCGASAAAGYESLDSGRFAQTLQQPGVTLIDVRTPEEYASGRIAGSRLMNFYDPSFRTQLASLDPNEAVAVYCRSGARSGEAARMLAAAGFTRVYNLRGGILSWDGPLVR